MSSTDDNDKTIYKVVLDGEEQYSIWPKGLENASGWRDEGTVGLKMECLEHIDKVWTDMRPLSLREHMEKFEKRTAVEGNLERREAVKRNVEDDRPGRLPPIVAKLSQGKHPITMTRYGGIDDLKQAIARGTVLVNFTETRGGTEIGIALDEKSKVIDLSASKIDLCGALTLDYHPVECIVSIDVETRAGIGYLKLYP